MHTRKAGKLTLFLVLSLFLLPRAGQAVTDVAAQAQRGTQIRNQIKELANQAKQIQHLKDQVEEAKRNSQKSLGLDELNDLLTQLSSVTEKLQASSTAPSQQFKDTRAYSQSRCYSSPCSDTEWEELKRNELVGSEAQKKAIDEALQRVEKQQKALADSARKLERLHQSAKDAKGHMAALDTANQLATQLVNQLLQLQSLLLAHQQMLTVRQQVQADREAKESASSAALRRGKFTPSPRVRWTIRGPK